MTQYAIGVKIVKFWADYNLVPMGAYPPGSEGYSVMYEDGYTSWSPKEVFEKHYLPMGETNNNKVTEEMVETFFGRDNIKTSQIDPKTVLMVVDTISGFRQYETSSCVDPANFDRLVGENICRDRVMDMLWKCLGFVVQWGCFGLRKEK